jgi:alpha-galactosidase
MSKSSLATLIIPALAILAMAAMPAGAQAADDTVKLFVMAGQSNAEGKAKTDLWDYQAEAPDTKDFFAHFRKDGKWIVRDDVFIKFLGRHGNLTVGYGSPGCTSSELEFGFILGDYYQEPVIVIKTAWGGHSLYQKFRSPSAGMPAEDRLEKELENARKKNPKATMEDIKAQYGISYRNMMSEIKDLQENYATLFPAMKGKKLEIAGFYWFQGFNDKFGEYAPKEYEQNMKLFIQDVRKDLNVPNLPFVIAAIGTNMSKEPSGANKEVMDAQLAMNDVPEFKGTVKAFRTDLLVDKKAEAAYPTWKQNFEEWKKVGSGRPYHYLGSAIWYTRIGKAAGNAMVELLKSQKK